MQFHHGEVELERVGLVVGVEVELGDTVQFAAGRSVAGAHADCQHLDVFPEEAVVELPGLVEELTV